MVHKIKKAIKQVEWVRREDTMGGTSLNWDSTDGKFHINLTMPLGQPDEKIIDVYDNRKGSEGYVVSNIVFNTKEKALNFVYEMQRFLNSYNISRKS